MNIDRAKPTTLAAGAGSSGSTVARKRTLAGESLAAKASGKQTEMVCQVNRPSWLDLLESIVCEEVQKHSTQDYLDPQDRKLMTALGKVPGVAKHGESTVSQARFVDSVRTLLSDHYRAQLNDASARRTYTSIDRSCFRIAFTMNPDNPWIVLFPDLFDREGNAVVDGYGQSVGEILPWERIILCDDTNSSFPINLRSFFETVRVRALKFESDCMQIIQPDYVPRIISSAEKQRMIAACPPSADFFRAVETLLNDGDMQNDSAVYRLERLRQALQKGDAYHGGKEMEAGSAGHVGIVEFYNWFNSQSKAFRTNLRNLHVGKRYRYESSLGYILDQLFKPLELARFNGVRYCLWILGQKLDAIIVNNRHKLTEIGRGQEWELNEAFDRVISYFDDGFGELAKTNDAPLYDFLQNSPDRPLENMNAGSPVFKIGEFGTREMFYKSISKTGAQNSGYPWINTQGDTLFHHVAKNTKDVGRMDFLLKAYSNRLIKPASNSIADRLRRKFNKLAHVTIPAFKRSYKGNQPIHVAASEGSADALRALIAAGCSIKKKNKDGKGFTPLYLAASAGHLEAVRVLLDAGVGFDVKSFRQALIGKHTQVAWAILETLDNKNKILDSYGNTAFHLAAIFGAPTLVQRLIDMGAYPSDLNKKGTSLLQAAAEKGHIEVIKVLGPYYTKEDLGEVLIVACMEGQWAAAEALLELKANTSWFCVGDGKTPLIYAIEAGEMRLVETLLAAGAEIGKEYDRKLNPLWVAVEHNRSEIIKLIASDFTKADLGQALVFACKMCRWDAAVTLVNLGAKTTCVDTSSKRTPFVFAAEFGVIKLVKALMVKEAHLEKHRNLRLSAIVRAARNNHVEIIKILAPFSSVGEINLALFDAARDGKWLAARELVRRGATNSFYDTKTGNTPFTYAAEAGQVELIKELLDAGADPSPDVNRGISALREAAKYGHIEVIKLLAPLFSDDCLGEALARATMGGQWAAAQTLLDFGAEANFYDLEEENTPLIYAAEAGQMELVKSLLAAGASLDERNKEGLTPYMAASKNGHLKLLDILSAPVS